MTEVTVVGAGLAGCEAAWQLAQRDVAVRLVEMRPVRMTPAHKTGDFAELVCSNSLRSDALTNAVGVLKEEMRRLGSLIMQVADEHRLPAGSALAVDRERFSRAVTERISAHPRITIVRQEVQQIPEGPCIIASGPLTSDSLSRSIREFLQQESFYFYDAAAPIIEKDSIDFSKAYYKSRYDKGEADYINCPMTRQEFEAFYDALIHAQTVELKEFEKEIYFEGCMPFEEMARRGEKTLLFGPMKPVGLVDKRTGVENYAVVQLRQDNSAKTLYNLVGFQTNLKWGSQKELIHSIPGLENANIMRYGVMHRNTFINSPAILNSTLQTRKRQNLFFAGQITGTEGYTESIASGLLAGINMAKLINNEELLVLPKTTVLGALTNYISDENHNNFQPVNSNWGILDSVELPKKERKNKKLKAEKMSQRSLEVLHSLEHMI